MPQIKVKTEYIKKLKQLGIYDQWLVNVKCQWGSNWNCDPVKMHVATTFHDFLNWSFDWSMSPEQHDFWSKIANGK